MVLVGFLVLPPAFSQEISGIAQQQLLRQQQREEAQRKLDESQPDVRLQGPQAALLAGYPAQESPCFVIDRVRLEGEQSGDFQWALGAAKSALGRCLGSAGINVLLGQVQNALVGRGYVTTRVVAAPQDLRAGELRLQLVPGRIRQVRFAGEQPGHWRLALPARSGELLNLRAIEQGLENFKRVPGAEADIQVVPAELPGESDLLVTWKAVAGCAPASPRTTAAARPPAPTRAAPRSRSITRPACRTCST